MADYSRNHSESNRGGYKKSRPQNSSNSKRSYGDRTEGGYRKQEGESPFRGEKKKPFDSQRGGKRYDDRNSNGPRKDRFSKDRNSNGPRRDFDRDRKQGYKDREAEKTDYRPSKKAPEIDTDVTGKELENWTLRALRQLEAQNAETVAKHLVMVGRYLDIDPDFALEHAIAASKRAGRIGVVREVVGIAAYAAENFGLALRELRTHRRISGSHDHLALLVDCERALGRVDKALTLADEANQEEVPAAVRSEVAIVVSGIYLDRGELSKAISALEMPELNPKRGYDYSPRLFKAYAELLQQDGRTKEAARWARLALMTEAALGQGDFVEPEIFDIFTEEDLLEPEEVSVDLEAAEAQSQESAPSDQETSQAEDPVAGLDDAQEGLTTAEAVVSEEETEEENLHQVSADHEAPIEDEA
ncbi:hypothetical protein ACN082_06265 [Rothia sp. CCM 9417]|uniref:hypothetical protein n=1 Tax=Rothia sp. CCM 9417 TaxID=3402657 RepID=UPI003ADEEF40